MPPRYDIFEHITPVLLLGGTMVGDGTIGMLGLGGASHLGPNKRCNKRLNDEFTLGFILAFLKNTMIKKMCNFSAKKS